MVHNSNIQAYIATIFYVMFSLYVFFLIIYFSLVVKLFFSLKRWLRHNANFSPDVPLPHATLYSCLSVCVCVCVCVRFSLSLTLPLSACLSAFLVKCLRL